MPYPVSVLQLPRMPSGERVLSVNRINERSLRWTEDKRDKKKKGSCCEQTCLHIGAKVHESSREEVGLVEKRADRKHNHVTTNMYSTLYPINGTIKGAMRGNKRSHRHDRGTELTQEQEDTKWAHLKQRYINPICVKPQGPGYQSQSNYLLTPTHFYTHASIK